MNVTARWCRAFKDIPAPAWDALDTSHHPFLNHAFLAGLEQHGCLRPDWGWHPLHLTLWEDACLIAAAPGYLKTNSHGEFIFDHAWAQAYARHGQDYFPKWLCGVPYSPVTGPRLLGPPKYHLDLLAAIRALVEHGGLSSAHVNFHTEAEDAAFGADWLQRLDLQYHWHNTAGWQDFDHFLAAMNHKHRKNIRQERAKVRQSGVRIRVLHGDEASESDLHAMYGFYLKTFQAYGNAPALTIEFLSHLASTLPRHLVMFLAEQGQKPIAGALCLRSGDTLYGRYWGGEPLPGLHFETCYYQGIDYCLREGLRRFEPGAQGEHKIARGFLPVQVRSHHWIANRQFHAPLMHWCAQERQSIDRRALDLAQHSPFRN